ncbi:hypothetical protein H0H93_005685 [Arthromyces matolae]|nr:hypothetical protein H0H93_005685 [Arthromyces matolae]
MTELTQIFQTLSQNKQKAKFIQQLHVEAPYFNHPSEAELAMRPLVSTLPTMNRLTELRLRLSKTKDPSLDQELITILKARYFNLKTFFCFDWIDLMDIIKTHPDLQYLGVYGHDELIPPLLDEIQTYTIPTRYLPRPPPPFMFSLERDSYFPQPNILTLCPGLLQPRRINIHKLTTTFMAMLDDDNDRYARLNRDYIRHVKLYFQNLEDTDYIEEFLSDIMKFLPNITELNLFSSRSSLIKNKKNPIKPSPTRRTHIPLYLQPFPEEISAQ